MIALMPSQAGAWEGGKILEMIELNDTHPTV